MSGDHARFSPSSSYHWLNCPKSEEIVSTLPPDEDNAASREGTLLHEEMENFLTKYGIGYFSPARKTTYKKFLKSFSKKSLMERGTMSSNLYLSMVDLYKMLVELGAGEGGENLTEKYEARVKMDSVVKDCWGTADLIFITPKALVIADFKFGRMKISPEASQLSLYSIGTYKKFVEGKKKYSGVSTIVQAIIQPKLSSSFSSVSYSVPELQAIAKEYKTRAGKNLLKKRREVVGPWCEYFARCRPYCKTWIDKNKKETDSIFKNAGY